jgi:hypothetical protein
VTKGLNFSLYTIREHVKALFTIPNFLPTKLKYKHGPVHSFFKQEGKLRKINLLSQPLHAFCSTHWYSTTVYTRINIGPTLYHLSSFLKICYSCTSYFCWTVSSLQCNPKQESSAVFMWATDKACCTLKCHHHPGHFPLPLMSCCGQAEMPQCWISGPRWQSVRS